MGAEYIQASPSSIAALRDVRSWLASGFARLTSTAASNSRPRNPFITMEAEDGHRVSGKADGRWSSRT